MNNIQQIFHNHSLYDIKDTASVQVDPTKSTSNLVVFFYNTSQQNMEEEQHVFLSKILQACKIDIATVALINVAEKLSFQTYVQDLNTQKAIFFGVPFSLMGWQKQLPAYQLLEIKGIQCINAHSLEEIKLDKQKKTALWTLLQEMFALT